jgi:hypothetical protein
MTGDALHKLKSLVLYTLRDRGERVVMAADFVTISILEISETNFAPAKKHKLWKKFEFLEART